MSQEAIHKIKVFISYAKEDLDAAQKLHKHLDEAGLEPWLDEINSTPGRNWRSEIGEAIRDSRYFIALLSSNSVEARGKVQKQLKEALNILDEFPSDDVFIIPVRLDNCNVSEEKVTALTMVDLFRDWRSGIERILKAMSVDANSLRKDNGYSYASKDDKLPVKLDEIYWNKLLEKFDEQNCIPFIGPDASNFEKYDGTRWFPSYTEIALKWINKYHYPFGSADMSEKIKQFDFPLDGSYLLASVAQFLAIENDQHDKNIPKYLLSEELKKTPNFSLPEYRNTAYAFLADLDLKIYITTNYDLLMEKALKDKGKKPISEFCRWNNDLVNIDSGIDKHYTPDEHAPLVFHLHGVIDEVNSMVLTEKDYFDYIINMNKENEKDLLPMVLRRELPNSSLLFIGYTVEGINFRTIFQGALSFLKSLKVSVAIQIPPITDNNKKQRILDYLNHYTRNMFEVHAYPGEVSNFVAEFRERWERFQKEKKS